MGATRFTEFEVVMRVRIQTATVGAPSAADIGAETVEALRQFDVWPVEVVNLEDGTSVEMDIPTQQ